MFLLVGNTLRCSALQTVDVQEQVTVQQMASGNFMKHVVVRRIVWQSYFLKKPECSALIKLQSTVLVAAIDKDLVR